LLDRDPENNVYGRSRVALAFIHLRPGYFAHVISELLFWFGPDNPFTASDYGIWTPNADRQVHGVRDSGGRCHQETVRFCRSEPKAKILGLMPRRSTHRCPRPKNQIKAGGVLCSLAPKPSTLRCDRHDVHFHGRRTELTMAETGKSRKG